MLLGPTTRRTTSFVRYYESDKPLKEQYCINYVNCLTAWLQTRGDTFTNNSLLMLVRDFIESLKKLLDNSPYLADVVDEADKAIASVFESKGVVSIKKRRHVDMSADAPPEATFDEVTVLNKQCMEMIPEQLSIVEFMFLSRITPYDYYKYLNAQTRDASAVTPYIEWHKLVSQWVAYEIIRHADVDKRYKALTTFFLLAMKLLQKNNVNSFISVMDALQHQTVRRLSATWNRMTKDDWILYTDLQGVQETIRSNNYSITLRPPCVPDFCLLVAGG